MKPIGENNINILFVNIKGTLYNNSVFDKYAKIYKFIYTQNIYKSQGMLNVAQTIYNFHIFGNYKKDKSCIMN